jgi:hypothetical protein
MAIRLKFINLIIPIAKIERCYAGGFESFVSENKELIRRRVWYDDYLFRDGAMNPRDMEHLVREWVRRGLVPFEESDGRQIWKDMCVVEPILGGPTLPCDWLEFDRQDNCVFLKGFSKGRVIGREDMETF